MARRIKVLVALVTAMALTSVATWLVAERTLRSPAQVAAEAEPPEPGLVTAPVEERTITSEVVARGTVVFDEPTEIELSGQPDVDGEAVVTRAPQADAEVAEGDVLAEVSGRPVLALAGELPAYRDLRPGVSGDDVAQLQQGLARLGYDPGEADGRFGPATEEAVAAWYRDAGFDPPEPSPEEQDRLEQAEDARDAAAEALADAEQALREAEEGPAEVEVLQAERRVDQARREVESAPPGSAEDERAHTDLAIARAELEELRTVDTSRESEAVAQARADLDEAEAELGELRGETGTWVPAAELAVVADLPRRVNSVEAELGDEASGALATVTEGEVVVEGAVAAEDAELIEEGADAELVPDDAEPLTGSVTELDDDSEGDDVRVVVAPDDEDAAEELLDDSVRLDVPVQSTDGNVLAVPLAALAAAGDGDPRVEVVRDADGGTVDADAETEFVTVRTGLSADGTAEIEPVDGDLDAGDLVVVGDDGTPSEGAGE